MRGPVLLLGKQGAGKGTVGRLLARELDATHLSAGTLLRQHVREGGRWAVEIQGRIDRGLGVPEHISYGLLSDAMRLVDLDRPLLLDGYPREVSQTVLLGECVGRDPELVVVLNVPRPIAVHRLLTRETCGDCDATFGPGFPSEVARVCNYCGGRLRRRADDAGRAIARRIDGWSSRSPAIISHFKTTSEVSEIDASGSIEDVKDKVFSAVLNLRN